MYSIGNLSAAQSNRRLSDRPVAFTALRHALLQQLEITFALLRICSRQSVHFQPINLPASLLCRSTRKENMIPTYRPNKESKASLVVNGRYRVHRVTGLQRYAHEIVARLPADVEVCAPQSAKGIVGHLWEQTALPRACKGRLLWSPCGSGPLGYNRHLVTFHDLFPLEYPEWYSSAYATWYGVAMRTLAARAIHLIAVSEYTKSRIVKLLGRNPEEITVIHNGCHTRSRADERQIHEAHRALKLPTRRYVLSLSSLESRKNVGALLKAWSSIHSRLPEDVWLVLAGPKADEAVYGKQEVAVDLPRVLFTGYVPEEHLAGLYSGATLFVFPSLAEGFGLPLLEAMACGVPCITSRTSSLPEVGGDVVDYIDPRNTAELAQTMLQNLRKNRDISVPFTAAMERAKRFTWELAASKTRDVMAAALTANPKVRVPIMERTAAL